MSVKPPSQTWKVQIPYNPLLDQQYLSNPLGILSHYGLKPKYPGNHRGGNRPLKRSFGGSEYTLGLIREEGHFPLSESRKIPLLEQANRIAKYVRAKGLNARVVEWSKGVGIYMKQGSLKPKESGWVKEGKYLAWELNEDSTPMAHAFGPMNFLRPHWNSRSAISNVQDEIRWHGYPGTWHTKKSKSKATADFDIRPITYMKKKDPTPELTGLRRNIMGTTSFTLKGGSMRKPQEFIIYPKNENDGLPPYVFTIQSDTRIGLIDMKNGGRILAAPPVSSGAYFIHLQFALGNKTAQSLGTLEKSDYEALFDAIGATANTWDDRIEVIRTDNTGAGFDFLNSVGKGTEKE